MVYIKPLMAKGNFRRQLGGKSFAVSWIFRLSGFWCGMPLQVFTDLRTVSPRRGPRERPGDEPRPTAQTQ
ncbi:hypothetical protein, partial [Methylobacterium fujisawaense]